MPLKLAVITTHPIQYYAPLFREMSRRQEVRLHVFYNWKAGTEAAYDPGFESDVTWDVPLLDGYEWTFVPNRSPDPGTHHFWGLINPCLVPQVRSWRPDAVLVYGWNYASHLWALIQLHGGVPILFRGDSTLIDERPGLRKWLRRAFLSWVYRHVDRALPVGTHSQRYFTAHGFTEEELSWAPHSVNNERFKDPTGELEAEAQAWRRDLGIADGDTSILFAGKLEPKKAPGRLLQAYDHVARSDTHLVLAGSGPLEADLREAAREVPNVHFLGFQNQSRMPTVYRLGDLFVLPSRGPGETWGLAVNEAMTCGRAVCVSNRVGCAPDLVEDGIRGYVFASDTPGSLRSTLRRALREADQLPEMGRRAAERIQDWSLEGEAIRIEQAVTREIKEKGLVNRGE